MTGPLTIDHGWSQKGNPGKKVWADSSTARGRMMDAPSEPISNPNGGGGSQNKSYFSK
ncbi:hypothetical protein PITCH_A920022 [uncultured Desulfobacterium sp.]|uniref:Uncharacterized protein n=1 Tax=uncultured Desulfobacterium sp. TaxID=201089 RepID=A0A445N3X8_9BACT|nr:hypothetical protein PITCH_A920022 [uncultured Desulfobacterium sp.]